MAHFLFRARYTQSGLQGMLKEGAASRIKAVTELAESVGGRVETAYWAFGDDDFVMIAELPSNAAAAALATRVSASGSVGVSTTPLLTADEVDQARGLGATYVRLAPEPGAASASHRNASPRNHDRGYPRDVDAMCVAAPRGRPASRQAVRLHIGSRRQKGST